MGSLYVFTQHTRNLLKMKFLFIPLIFSKFHSFVLLQYFYRFLIYIISKHLIIYSINQGGTIYPNFTDNSWGAAVSLVLKSGTGACTLHLPSSYFYKGHSFSCCWFPSFYSSCWYVCYQYDLKCSGSDSSGICPDYQIAVIGTHYLWSGHKLKTYRWKVLPPWKRKKKIESTLLSQHYLQSKAKKENEEENFELPDCWGHGWGLKEL